MISDDATWPAAGHSTELPPRWPYNGEEVERADNYTDAGHIVLEAYTGQTKQYKTGQLAWHHFASWPSTVCLTAGLTMDVPMRWPIKASWKKTVHL